MSSFVDFTNHIEKILPESRSFFHAQNEPYLRGIRVNSKRNEFRHSLGVIGENVENVKWYLNGFYYSNEKIAKNPLYSAGCFYIQEPSAMLPASVLPIDENDMVLDLCAAPGGKSTLIGEKIGESGLLVANDISHSRCAPLAKNIERHGIRNMCVLNENSEKLKNNFFEFFDKILIDAPCSGEGMFRKDPKAKGAWLEKGPAYYTPIQTGLLEDAASMLKSGGMIAYSTCTFNTMENEEVISQFLASHNDFEPYFINHEAYGVSKGLMGMDFCARIWPHLQKGEGHFLAILRKKGEMPLSAAEQTVEKPHNKDSTKAISEFLEENIKTKLTGNIVFHEDTAMLASPYLPDLSGIRVFRSGMKLGNIKDKRFEPEQGLAMTLSQDNAKNALNFDMEDINVFKYLNGESLDIVVPKGWYLICVNKNPLGWAKSDGKRLKNKMARGWISNLIN